MPPVTITIHVDAHAGTGTLTAKEGDIATIFDFTTGDDHREATANALANAWDKLEETLANPPDGKTVIARPATSTTPAKHAKKPDATKPKGKAAVDSDGFTLIDMFAVPATTTPAPATATVDEDIFAIDF